MDLYIAIPALNEYDYLPNCLKAIEGQTYRNFSVFICINQPEEWWNRDDKIEVCLNNQKTLNYLYSYKKNQNFVVEIIDKSSKGQGWVGKHRGVGWARKLLMDFISQKAKPQDIIVNLDADATFSENYFQSIVDTFNKYPEGAALSNPYYHKLTDNEDLNRAILYYEIYLRYYSLNLWRISSPYSFTAIGTTISLPVWVYKKIKGITPRTSGEDFYFLQKIRKFRKIINYNTEFVYPSARFSDRVGFGTGPALIKGNIGNWQSYPIFNYTFFDEIQSLYTLFPVLFTEDITSGTIDILEKILKTNQIFQPLRKNFKKLNLFVKACHQKIDALRVLQFLKYRHKSENLGKTDELRLKEFLYSFYQKDIIEKSIDKILHNLLILTFRNINITELNSLRNYLMEKELEYQKKYIYDASEVV